MYRTADAHVREMDSDTFSIPCCCIVTKKVFLENKNIWPVPKELREKGISDCIFKYIAL